MSAVVARSLPSRWGVSLGVIAALLVGLLLFYADTASSMVTTWSRSDTYAHAFLVPPITLWLIWRRRHRLARMTPQPQPWVLLPMALTGLLWLLGYLASVTAAMQIALVAMIVLLVPAVAGLAVARELMFPLGFLFFAVPIGEFLTPFMIARTADATVAALRWTGVPVYREGMEFVIPSGHWSVVEACSGVRYLIASFMVGTLFAYLNYRSTRRRLLFVAVSLLVPIVANWMRAYLIVMLGHLSNNRIATGVDHLVYGWVFFGIVIMMMFIVGARWAEPDDPGPTSASASASAEAQPAALSARPAAVAALLAGVVLAVTWPQLAAIAVQDAESQRDPQLKLPDMLADHWRASDQPAADWAPGFLNPSIAADRTYVRDGRRVGVYVAYYRGQSADRKLVTSTNTLAGVGKHARWRQISGGKREVADIDGSTTVLTARLRDSEVAGLGSSDRLLVWQVYWVNDRLVASDSLAKIEGALARLLGRGDEGAVLLFYTPYIEGNVAAAESTLQAFVGPQLQTLQALLRTTRDAR